MTVKHTTWHTHLVKNPKQGEPITQLVEGFSCNDCENHITETKAVITKENSIKTSSKEQAELALAMLRNGPVTTAQLAIINRKYPSDPIYHLRKIIGHDKVLTVKENGKTTYKLV